MMRTHTQKQWDLDRHRGIPTVQPLGPVRAHIDVLLACTGGAYRTIGDAAGIKRETVRYIHKRSTTYVNARLAARILAVTPMALLVDPVALRPAIGSVRRLRALQAIGWPYRCIAGDGHLAVRSLLRDGHARANVTGRVHLAVKAVYDELSMTPGPSQHTRNRAAKAGYQPPLAWDEDTIDDPEAVPDAGVRTKGIDMAEVEFLLRSGEWGENLARRFGTTTDSLERLCYRRDRPDLVLWVRTGERRAA